MKSSKLGDHFELVNNEYTITVWHNNNPLTLKDAKKLAVEHPDRLVRSWLKRKIVSLKHDDWIDNAVPEVPKCICIYGAY